MDIAVLATLVALLALQQILHTRERARTDDVVRQLTNSVLAIADADREPHPDLALLIASNDRLAQRIQAPEYAVVEHAQTQALPPLPQAVEMDDDERHWQTRDELAENEYLEDMRRQHEQAMKLDLVDA